MFEANIKQFLISHKESDALNIISDTRKAGLCNIAVFLGEFFEEQFPYSSSIKDEYAISNHFIGKYNESFEIFQRLLQFGNLSEEDSKIVIFNAHFSINHIENNYIHYNSDKVIEIRERRKKNFPLITVTITTCKRLELFILTMNSFINCCEDINMVDEWICVDDNSSDDDRQKMRTMYPFITFYYKDESVKGHPCSMNVIHGLVKTPYIFHLEDDWKFFTRKNYLTDCLNIMSVDPKIGQCLINKNYAETESDISIVGGVFKQTKSGLRYYIHEYVTTKEEQKEWIKKHGDICRHCNYWPHFSFRPSLIRTEILRDLGLFNTTISHFEMEYSKRYVSKGYVSAFLEGIYCLHTGRLTSQMNDPTKLNAYILNDEMQFSGKEKKLKKEHIYKPRIKLEDFDFKLKTYVVNLDRRPDRWETFQQKATPLLTFLKYERFSAIDGSKLQTTHQIQRIFDNNDYNMRKGMVGCAMSHIKLYTDLVNSEYEAFLILEDDLEFVPEFDKKLLHSYKQLKLFSWDMMYLGHHLHTQYKSDDVYDKEKLPRIEKWDVHTSLTRSMGGTGGYLISKQGAKKLLEFINSNGMTNGIDTVQQKASNIMNTFYCCPHLFYSKCFMGDNNLDTDVQYDYDSLTMNIEDRINNDIIHHGNITQLDNFITAIEFVTQKQTNKAYFRGTPKNVNQIQQQSIHPCYTIENSVLFIIPGGDEERYFNRVKKGDKYNVNDAIIYN
jgi:GR25 family glycosyltransferase involved in LPS biosynthesis